MSEYIQERLQKVIHLLGKIGKKRERQEKKIENLQKKLRKQQGILFEMKRKEEKLRDAYDFFYRADYDDDDLSRIQTINALNRQLYNNQHATEQQKQNTRVKLPYESE